jgi:hypothetical protein
MLIAALLALHGAIHLMGPIDFWEIADIDGIAPPNAPDAVVAALGAHWLLAAVGLIAGAALLWRGDHRWRPLVLAAAVLSFVIAGAVWQDAWAGMVVDAVIALVALPGRVIARPEAGAIVPADGAVSRARVTGWRSLRERVAARG